MNRAERRKIEKLNKQPNAIFQEQQLLEQALQFHQQKNYTEAKKLYQRVLVLNPQQPDAMHMLGILARHAGQNETAEKLIQQALKISPYNSEAYANLGVVLLAQGKREEALNAFRQSTALNPANHEAAYNALKLLYHAKRVDEATAYTKELVNAHHKQEMLGAVALAAGEYGNWQDAVYYFKEALFLAPNDVNLWNNLGNAHKENKDITEAELAYKRAIDLHATHAITYYNRAGLYMAQGWLAKAEQDYLHALELDPQLNQAHLNLGLLYQGQGRLDLAKKHVKHAFDAQPDSMMAHSSYLFMMHCDPSITPQDIYKESLAWGEQHADSLPRHLHKNQPDAQRRLRVGYVSADLRKHAVASYIEPVLRSHDKSNVEVFCYSNSSISDETTKQLQSYADHWRDIIGLTDEVVAEQIQRDKIDILIDLSGHTGGHRLQVFARKPAPIQATWIGYFNTIGMKAMDYIITDRFLLPPEEEHLYVEKPLRLPHSAAVYKMRDLPIEVNELPALTNGYVTFGCFNSLTKMTSEVMELWVRILKQVPNAKLSLKNNSFDDADIRKDYHKRFEDLGISEDRLIFAGFSPIDEYLKAYNHVDIGLDPFPYNGGTTTLDSLWMGVPMIALRGDRLIGHVGESLLAAVGLEEFIAANKAEYVAKAVAFANDIPKLAAIRAKLRPTLAATPNTNPVQFTQGLESAFRDIWREWCNTRK